MSTEVAAGDQIKSVVERVEVLEAEKRDISESIKEVYTEAKGNGLDVKALRTIVSMRRLDPNERAENETVLETYLKAMGML
jgi:uncharacterized protein (UPF0335 family)